MAKKIIQITNDNHQFAGNKENKVNGLIHIEDWFDSFLEQNGDYWKETYFELLTFESEFYYLKEFIVQARLLAVDEVVKQIKMGTGTQKIINSIPEWIPNTLSPFELLLTKWIVADYIYTHKLGVLSNTHTFYNTVKIIVERDTQTFPIQIHLQTSFDWTIDINWVNNKWRLIKVEKKQSLQNNSGNRQSIKQAKPIWWQGTGRQLGYLLDELAAKGFIDKNTDFNEAMKVHFIDKEQKPVTDSIKQNKSGASNTNKNGKPKGANVVDEIIKGLPNNQ